MDNEDVRWYVTDSSHGRILTGPYATPQEAEPFRNRDAGQWITGMNDDYAATYGEQILG